MRPYTIAAILLCLALTSAAASVNPDYVGIKDSGSASLPALRVGISLDCSSKAATVTVLSNDTGLPVQGAKTYMFYTDYGYYALPNTGTTGADGVAVMAVPGNIRYLTALFVLRTDAQGYQSREIEYTYDKCFGNSSAVAQNATVAPQNATTNQTAPEANATQPQQPSNATPAQNAANQSGTMPANATATPNGTSPAGGGGSQPSSACPGAAAVISLALLGAARWGS